MESKKLSRYLIIFIFLVPSYIFSQSINQISKGKFMTGGLISLKIKNIETVNLERKNSSKEKFFEVSPNLGYYLLNGFAIGIDFSYQRFQYGYNDSILPTIDNKTTLNPFVKLYFHKNFGAYTTLKYGKGISYINIYDLLAENGYYKYKINHDYLNIGIGYSKFIKDDISLDFSVNYYKTKLSGDQYFVQTDKNSGINIFVGFQIYLGKEDE